MLALFHLSVTCHQGGHIPPPAESRGGWPLFFSIRHSPPAESLGNQVGRLTFIFLSSWGLEAHTTLRNGCRCHRHCNFWCVVWFHGTCGIQTSRRVSRDYIWPAFRRFPVHPPALPYPNRGVVWRSVKSVFTRLFTPFIAYFSAPPGYVHLYVESCRPITAVWTVFPPRGCESYTKAPWVAVYMFLQPGPAWAST